MSSSSPLAAQDHMATRSVDSSDVEPGDTVTVTITLADDYTGNLARVTESLDDGLTYVPGSVEGASFRSADSDVANGTLVFQMFSLGSISGESFSYEVTASDTDGSYNIEGELRDADSNTHTIEATTITVETAPMQTGPQPAANDLQFDVVASKAVKDAQVSKVGMPIDSKPLTWVIDTDDTLGDFDGSAGNFEVRHDGDGVFGLYVMNSGAPDLDGSQSIRVELPYTNSDGDVLTTILTGDVNERVALSVVGPVEFTIPQNVADETPIHYFKVSDPLAGESLDGIITKDPSTATDDSAPFGVNDANMTIYRKNGAALEVRDYKFLLTVNGDAGLAARADRVNVTVTVTASNTKHTHASGKFEETIYENMKGAGLVSAGTAVGDASADITNLDGDKLTYTDDSDLFDTNKDTGAVTVGPDGIGDIDVSEPLQFHITVSDGVTANDVVIEAAVTVDANAPVTAKSDDLPAGVTHSAPATYTVTTPEVAGTVNGYHILNVSALVNLDLDADGETETPTYTPSVRTAPLNVDADGRLLLTHVPRGFQDGVEGEALDTITVEIDDGYNDPVTITINVVLNVKEKPDQITPSLTASIDENMTGEVQAALKDLDATGNDTLAELIALINEVESDGDGVEYKHTGGTNTGRPGADAIFEVDSATGAISLDMAQDADALSVMPSVVLQVERDSDGADLGVVFVAITINDVNEAPAFMADAPSSINVDENVQPGTNVGDAPITASDQDAGDSITYSITESGVPFAIDSASGQISVSGALVLADQPYSVTVVATDDGTPSMSAEHALSITIGDVNDPPMFDQPATTTASIAENTAAGTVVATYNASDDDGDDVHQDIHYELRNADDLKNFAIVQETVNGERIGKLVVKEGANLDVDADGAATSYTVEVNVKDADDADSELVIEISITDVNDNAPMFSTDNSVIITVVENAARARRLLRR